MEKGEQMPDQNPGSSKAKPKSKSKGGGKTAAATTPVGYPWLELDQPAERSLKVYALDPSAGNYIGNVMTLRVT